jgi:hypothetical protein
MNEEWNQTTYQLPHILALGSTAAADECPTAAPDGAAAAAAAVEEEEDDEDEEDEELED